MGVEVNGGQGIWVKLIEAEQRQRNIFCEIGPIQQNKDKFSRILGLHPRYESGNLLLKQGMIELSDQMVRFPVAQRVDILDALAMQIQIVDPTLIVNKVKSWVPAKYRRAA